MFNLINTKKYFNKKLFRCLHNCRLLRNEHGPVETCCAGEINRYVHATCWYHIVGNITNVRIRHAHTQTEILKLLVINHTL